MGNEPFGFRNFLGGIAGTGVGMMTYPLLHTPRALWHLPSAWLRGARALVREPRIGPNLKTLILATSPIAAAAIPPIVVLGSSLAGLIYLARAGADPDRPGIIRQTRLDYRHAKEWVEGLLLRLHDYHPNPLAPGKKPFDIRVGEMLKGLLAGLGTTLFEGVSMLALFVLYSPKLLVRGLTGIGEILQEQPLLGLFMVILACAGLCLIVSLIPFAAVVGSLGLGCYRGYTKGLRAAIRSIGSDVRHANQMLAEV
jgi:hypothetical protein